MARQRIAIIGLGHFGLHLALSLTELGVEVLGIDEREERVELLRDRIAHTVVMDARDKRALAHLGLPEYDAVVVAIGEGFESSILTTAYLQEMNVKRIINRIVSPVHERILRLMNVHELVLPEGEAASQLARRISMKGVLEHFGISSDYSLIEARLPAWAANKSLQDLDLRRRFNLNLITVLRDEVQSLPVIGGVRPQRTVLGVPEATMKLSNEDILVLFGKESDLRKFLKH